MFSLLIDYSNFTRIIAFILSSRLLNISWKNWITMFDRKVDITFYREVKIS